MRTSFSVFIAAFLLLAGRAVAQKSVMALLEDKLMARVQALDKDLTGVLGVAAIDLQTGAVLEYNADVVFPQASSIKIPIMAEVFRQAEAGKIQLDMPITLTSADAVGGSGELQSSLRSRELTLSVRELVVKMIAASDNTATNRLIGLVGMDNVNRWIDEAGMKHTRLQRRMLDTRAALDNKENVSTPAEMARLAELLYRGRAVSPDSSKAMVEILRQSNSYFRSAIPSSIAIASKYGELDGVRAETGIIFVPNHPFVLSVMSTYLDNETNPVPAVAKMFYEHFQKLANSNRYGHKLQ